MLIDARNLEDGTLVQTDVCVVGGGAAGIAIAREFRSSGLNVVLLESGGIKEERETQQLYDGITDGPFNETDYCLASRCRYFGGTTNKWTGTCRPLDDIDFEYRPWVEHSGWPIRRSTLDEYYTRAADILDCHPFDEHRGDGQLVPLNLFSADGAPSRIVPKAMFRSTPIVRLGEKYGAELKAAENIRVLLHANLTELEANEAGQEIRQATIAVLHGPRFRIRAKAYVLAAGGIENARLLLASNRVIEQGLGNQYGNVGRYFMEHPRLTAAAHVVWTGPKPKALVDSYRDKLRRTPSSFYAMYTPSHEMQRQERMLNCGMVLLEAEKVRIDPLTVDSLRLATTLDGRDYWTPGVRVSQTFPKSANQVRFYIEQTPNPHSRITLDDQVDALGMRRSRIAWRIVDRNTDEVFRSLELLRARAWARVARSRPNCRRPRYDVSG